MPRRKQKGKIFFPRNQESYNMIKVFNQQRSGSVFTKNI